MSIRPFIEDDENIDGKLHDDGDQVWEQPGDKKICHRKSCLPNIQTEAAKCVLTHHTGLGSVHMVI